MQEPRREEDGENKITPNLWKREMDKAASSIWKKEGVEADKLGAKREEETRGEERLNMTVTGAEPSSPSREAARGDLNYFHLEQRHTGHQTIFLEVLVHLTHLAGCSSCFPVTVNQVVKLLSMHPVRRCTHPSRYSTIYLNHQIVRF